MKEDPIKLWQHIHGACAHFPIAMMMVSFVFDVAGVVLKRHAWRVVGFWTLMIAALVAIPLILSGLTGQLGWFGVEKWDAERMNLHRNVALIGGGIVILLAIWRLLRDTGDALPDAASDKPRRELKGGELAVYLVVLLAATAAIGYTGYLGAYVARGY